MFYNIILKSTYACFIRKFFVFSALTFLTFAGFQYFLRTFWKEFDNLSLATLNILRFHAVFVG